MLKFYVSNKCQNESGFCIKLKPVNCIENEEYFNDVPAGAIDLGSINQASADYLEVGNVYNIEITKEV